MISSKSLAYCFFHDRIRLETHLCENDIKLVKFSNEIKKIVHKFNFDPDFRWVSRFHKNMFGELRMFHLFTFRCFKTDESLNEFSKKKSFNECSKFIECKIVQLHTESIVKICLKKSWVMSDGVLSDRRIRISKNTLNLERL